ncbi:unknown [Acidaminococcus sp. CAG:917]|nr:unknown [Acidaminococcus sp. CAG:917]
MANTSKSVKSQRSSKNCGSKSVKNCGSGCGCDKASK